MVWLGAWNRSNHCRITNVGAGWCGGGLAREYGVSVDLISDWPTAFASKPAPTGDLRLTDRDYARGRLFIF